MELSVYQAAKPAREIRAIYGAETIRVYQAFQNTIALPALQKQTFVAPFEFTRMTWIKPSFLWMMTRSGWGRYCRFEGGKGQHEDDSTVLGMTGGEPA